MKSHDYWVQRSLKREKESYLRGETLNRELLDAYRKSAREISDRINRFYMRYAKKYRLSMDEAQKRLNRAEAHEWKKTLGEYVETINACQSERQKQRLMAELDALSANAQIDRLEELQGQIRLVVNELTVKATNQMQKSMAQNYSETYYHKAYDLQKQMQVFSKVNQLNPDLVQKVISYPWSGADFSDRLWQNKEKLLFTIRENLTQGIIQGKSIDALTQDLASSMGASYKTSERLVRTEMEHIHNRANFDTYKEEGIEYYEFVAGLDGRTCEICGSLDGQHFRRDEAIEGVNFPPVHPNCRCTTVAWDPDLKEDFKTSGVRFDYGMTYGQWKKEQDRIYGG